MAPRAQESLLAEYSKRNNGADFGWESKVTGAMTLFGASREAAEASVLAVLRKLVPTGTETEQRDWVAELLADDKNAALIANLRRNAADVAALIRAARETGAKITVSVDLESDKPEEAVKLANRLPISRTAIKRDYSKLREACEGTVTDLFYNIGRGEGKLTIKLPVKYTTPQTDKGGATIASGMQFQHGGKWHSIESLNQHVQERFKAQRAAEGKEGKQGVNTWVTVYTMLDEVKHTLADLYDDTFGTPDEDSASE